ncbi:MAG: sensor histidine kinase [Bacteroidetes bacterium]|nr:sensor histidine kinase [Bacteroidota bacterium]
MSRKRDGVYSKVCRMIGVPVNKKEKDKEAFMIRALTKIEKEFKQNKTAQRKTNKRINNILNVVEAYAKLQFDRKSFVGTSGDDFDALATGINMLGEELQSSTVSLKEKEVLFREVHHRVKNNLQIISSLLSLQMDGLSDKNSINFFADNTRRIRSMALVHETLYQSKDISGVDFACYLKALVLSVKDSYKNEKPIRVLLEAESHHLKIDTAIPCGLIINELITNSYKYAFDGKEDGEILLKFTKENVKGKPGNYKLNIRDNGIGLSRKFDINKSTTLGLQLVSMLTEQLDGTFSLESNKGVSFTIDFPG